MEELNGPIFCSLVASSTNGPSKYCSPFPNRDGNSFCRCSHYQPPTAFWWCKICVYIYIWSLYMSQLLLLASSQRSLRRSSACRAFAFFDRSPHSDCVGHWDLSVRHCSSMFGLRDLFRTFSLIDSVVSHDVTPPFIVIIVDVPAMFVFKYRAGLGKEKWGWSSPKRCLKGSIKASHSRWSLDFQLDIVSPH